MTEYIFYQPADVRDYRVIGAMLTWAQENCPSYVTNDYLKRGDGDFYRLYFKEERDYSWFLLRWQ